MTTETHPLSGVLYPGDNDVMLGRGGESNHHGGNAKFRDVAQTFRKRYKEAGKSDKAKIATDLVSAWRSLDPPGRFLTKTDPGSPDSLWHDAGDRVAIKRATKTLGGRSQRERREEKKRLMAMASMDQNATSLNHIRHRNSSTTTTTTHPSQSSEEFHSDSSSNGSSQQPGELMPPVGHAAEIPPGVFSAGAGSLSSITGISPASAVAGFWRTEVRTRTPPPHYMEIDHADERALLPKGGDLASIPTAADLTNTVFSEDDVEMQTGNHGCFNEDLRSWRGSGH